jgi:hypothetical protein
MKLAIMQPYLFPYIGYFQLIRAVDTFVVYDDVQFIKGGWINRNYILGAQDRQLITLPLVGASPNKLINQVQVGPQRGKLLATLRHAYARAPQFASVYPLVEGILTHPEDNLARFVDNGLRQVCAYLGLRPQWRVSSSLGKDNDLRGQDKVLAICRELGATHYINVPGGRALYDREAFAKEGLQLSFIQPLPAPYRQFSAAFTPNLSILDVMMFNAPQECSRLLEAFALD